MSVESIVDVTLVVPPRLPMGLPYPPYVTITTVVRTAKLGPNLHFLVRNIKCVSAPRRKLLGSRTLRALRPVGRNG